MKESDDTLKYYNYFSYLTAKMSFIGEESPEHRSSMREDGDNVLSSIQGSVINSVERDVRYSQNVFESKTKNRISLEDKGLIYGSVANRRSITFNPAKSKINRSMKIDCSNGPVKVISDISVLSSYC